MRNVKSSSGDTTYCNPYMKQFIGQEVTSSKIIRKSGEVILKIIKKIL